MARGEPSFSQVRALTRVATPDTEADLLALARGFSVFPDDDGTHAVRGLLPPEVGALLQRAIEAASDALYRQDRASAAAGAPTRTPEQRRADALALLAERALGVGFAEARVQRVEGDGCDLTPPPVSGTRAARYQVVLHLDAATLAEGGEPGRSELEEGTRVSAETSRRVSCDAGVVRATHGADGSILDVGRRTRTIPPALRRALEIRDRGCRFPGCGSRFTDAHHVHHWADGGDTSLANTLLLCTHHHTLVHEGGWLATWDGEGRPVFVDPRGGEHYDARPRAPELPDEPVGALVVKHARLGIVPDWRTAGARWKGERDIPGDVYFRALEAAG